MKAAVHLKFNTPHGVSENFPTTSWWRGSVPGEPARNRPWVLTEASHIVRRVSVSPDVELRTIASVTRGENACTGEVRYMRATFRMYESISGAQVCCYCGGESFEGYHCTQCGAS